MFEKAREIYRRTERYQGPAMLCAGSLWDFLTLTRIDRLADNFLFLAYVFVLGVLLVIERRAAHGVWLPAFVRRRARWTFLGTQFLYGGLYSAYVVYYARSAPWGSATLYVSLLVGLLVVNELADQKLRGDVVRFALYFFCLFSFLLFFVPVTTGWLLGFGTAGLFAMILTAPVVAAVHLFPGVIEQAEEADPELEAGHTFQGWAVRRALLLHGGLQLVMVIALMILGRTGVIPPVPLALQSSGIFHDVTATSEGYKLTYEDGWFNRDDRVYDWQPGDTVFCFTAIFAPTGLSLDVYHVWEWWQSDFRSWKEMDRLQWRVKGGRDAGFRGMTHKKSVKAGWWRVRVVTPDGRVLGVVRFRIRERPRSNDLTFRYY